MSKDSFSFTVSIWGRRKATTTEKESLDIFILSSATLSPLINHQEKMLAKTLG